MRATHAMAVLSVAALAAPLLAPAAGPAVEAAPATRRVHEVRRGDTLGALARHYGVTVAALVAANRLAGPGVVLRLGQRLVIPRPTAAAKSRAGALTAVRRAAVARPGPAAPRVPPGIILAVPDLDGVAVSFQWPTDGPVTSPFGRRRTGWHRGIDIKAERGTPVQAAAAGVVVASDFEARYGRVIKLEHDGGFVTVYAHNDANLVEVGEHVAAGETIATVGKTGRATTHHVHFEILRNGSNYDPLYLLPLPPLIGRVEETDENPPDDE